MTIHHAKRKAQDIFSRLRGKTPSKSEVIQISEDINVNKLFSNLNSNITGQETVQRVESIPDVNGLNALSKRCREANDTWWRDPLTGELLRDRNIGELLMLCVSELAEAMEGHRKDLQDTHLPHRKMFEVELADCLIRIFDLSGEFDLDLSGAFEEKMEYNSRRMDHRLEERLKPGGKKY